MSFQLHPQLATDCISIGELPLCKVLLMNDCHYPWLILVPQAPDITEVYELSAAEQQTLWQEISHCGEKLMAHLQGHKLNIGALGNMVPQLHVHIIVRDEGDAAWPGPVWGKVPALPYSSEQLTVLKRDLQTLLFS